MESTSIIVLKLIGAWIEPYVGWYLNTLEDIAALWDRTKGKPPRRILDSGYGGGLSHAVWLRAWPTVMVDCITPEPPGSHWGYDAVALMGPEYSSRLFIHIGLLEYLVKPNYPMVLPKAFDVIHIDTEHTYPAQLHQCRACWDRLALGGLLLCHDYDQPPVRRGIDEFCDEIDKEPDILECLDGTKFALIWR